MSLYTFYVRHGASLRHILYFLILTILCCHVVQCEDICLHETTAIKCAQSSMGGNSKLLCIVKGSKCIRDPCQDMKQEECTSPDNECWWSSIHYVCMSPESLCIRHLSKDYCDKVRICHWRGDYCAADKPPVCSVEGNALSPEDQLRDPKHEDLLKEFKKQCKSFPKAGLAIVVILLIGFLGVDGGLIYIIMRRRQQSVTTVRKEAVTLDLEPYPGSEGNGSTFAPPELSYAPPVAQEEDEEETTVAAPKSEETVAAAAAHHNEEDEDDLDV